MSRWEEIREITSEEYWQALCASVEELPTEDTGSFPDYLSEHDRLKRIMAFTANAISSISIDPDFLPYELKTKVESLRTEIANAVSSPNLANRNTHVQQANDLASQVVAMITPFTSTTKNTKAAREAQTAYKEMLEAKTQIIAEQASSAESSIETINDAQSQISVFQRKLFQGEEGVQSIEADLRHRHEEITGLYNEIYEGDASIESKIRTGLNEATENSKSIKTSLDDITPKVTELASFYDKVYGNEVEVGIRKGGLDDYIDTRKETIDSILKLATSAGLASAYNIRRTTAEKGANSMGWLFFGSLVVLFLYSLLIVRFATFSDLDKLIQNLLINITVVAPVIWLATSFSKRRSQMHRLAEEYAHKEALAMSYESYQEQIKDLENDEKREKLQAELMSQALTAIGNNAAQTLDKNHGDKMPMLEMMERVSKLPSEGVEFIKALSKK